MTQPAQQEAKRSKTAPVEERFSRQRVLQILGISERQLSAWKRQGLIQPSGSTPEADGPHGEDRCYSFSDLVAMKKLRQLRQSGIPPSRIRSLYSALKARLPGAGNPWTELQVPTHGKKLAVRFQGAVMEPLTGQLLLEYTPREELPGKIRTMKRSHSRQRSAEPAWVRAERFFQAGLRYEEHQDTLSKAIRAYQKAIELNPNAVGAHINLGTIYYKLRLLEEAEACYRTALLVDSGYSLVHFNLGNVYDESQEWEQALHHYEEAIRLAPSYADPHYNLALLYEKLGRHGKARQQWVAYVKLDPGSQWAATARQQMEKTSMRVLSPQKPSGTDS